MSDKALKVAETALETCRRGGLPDCWVSIVETLALCVVAYARQEKEIAQRLESAEARDRESSESLSRGIDALCALQAERDFLRAQLDMLKSGGGREVVVTPEHREEG